MLSQVTILTEHIVLWQGWVLKYEGIIGWLQVGYGHMQCQPSAWVLGF